MAALVQSLKKFPTVNVLQDGAVRNVKTLPIIVLTAVARLIPLRVLAFLTITYAYVT